MTIAVPITLFGWIPAVLLLFAMLHPRQAVIFSFIIAWLFLPNAGYAVSGFPDYTKVTATSVAVLLGVAIFDSSQVAIFRIAWLDTPVAIWCLAPMVSSLANGLGPYDGLSGTLDALITWGLPYFIGRLYFSDSVSIRNLVIGILVGGLIYIPLSLWEIRMSPQLHRIVYGFHPRGNWNVERFGGYRPRVFMESGLALGMWMTSASLIGIWLWRTRSLTSLWHAPAWMYVPVLSITTLLCKATGALALLAGGLCVLFLTKASRSRIFLICLLLAPVGYIAVRSTGEWSGTNVVEIAASFDEDRARSLEGRLKNEDILAAKAWERPVLGWGGWGRNRVYDDRGHDISVTDGLWIITFGQRGLVGLVSLYAILLLPTALLVCRVPVSHWATASFAPVAALAVLMVLFACDSLLNAMFNPVFVVCAGGLAGFASQIRRPSMARARLQRFAHAHT